VILEWRYSPGQNGTSFENPRTYNLIFQYFPINSACAVAQAIAKFVSDILEGEIICGIDRGVTLDKLALINNIIRPNNIIATLSHKMLQTKPAHVDHGTERIFLFTRDEAWVTPKF